jgi:ADP-ribose pyrophosphatase
MLKFEVLEKRRVFQGFQSIDEVKVEFLEADGTPSHTISRLVVDRGDAVGVLVYVRDAGDLVFVRQFRAPMVGHGEPWLTEIVAGMIDAGESPEAAARREVEEEIGYRAVELQPLAEMYSSPGGMSEKLFLYFAGVSATEKVGDGGGVDEHEDVELVSMPVSDAYAALRRGDLRDAKTQIAMLRAADLGLLVG